MRNEAEVQRIVLAEMAKRGRMLKPSIVAAKELTGDGQ